MILLTYTILLAYIILLGCLLIAFSSELRSAEIWQNKQQSLQQKTKFQFTFCEYKKFNSWNSQLAKGP